MAKNRKTPKVLDPGGFSLSIVGFNLISNVIAAVSFYIL
jgi:hypothetical protein